MLTNVDDIDYLVYSEFKTSDWYTYWDKSYAKTKPYQILVVWHIKEDAHVWYDYVTLSELLESGEATKALPYYSKLSKESADELVSIFKEFIQDVDKEFSTE